MVDTSWSESSAFVDVCKNVYQCKTLINLILTNLANSSQLFIYFPEHSKLTFKLTEHYRTYFFKIKLHDPRLCNITTYCSK